jgi:hypothetical protein
VVVPRDGVSDVAKGELPLGEPEPGSGILGPKRRQLDLANSRRRSAGRWRRRRLQFVVVYDGNSGSPMSLPVNGNTVEMRLVIFRARISYIISQINYDVLVDFSSTRSRVDGLHIYIYIIINVYTTLIKLLYYDLLNSPNSAK